MSLDMYHTTNNTWSAGYYSLAGFWCITQLQSQLKARLGTQHGVIHHPQQQLHHSIHTDSMWECSLLWVGSNTLHADR